jgi:[pyruvate, water dikinase]-phosphate phosphotransferase / [pyruvate, water dikinase] kinase
MQTRRIIFFISDGTGITAKTLGHSLLTQFEGLKFDTITLPYVNTTAKAQQAVLQIQLKQQEYGLQPIIFATLLDKHICQIIADSGVLFLDLFGTFIKPLEQELNLLSSHAIGKSRAINTAYNERIESINFALQHDDGQDTQRYEDADIILIGVSRSGKTPTCLYLAMQFGIAAANYPLTQEDYCLPQLLRNYGHKLLGLTIQAERLQKIRQERHPHSGYAALAQCQLELQTAEALYRTHAIPFVDTTSISVEEIATYILQTASIERFIF